MKCCDHSNWLLLTQEELNAKSTRELLAILQWARVMPRQEISAVLEQRAALQIRTKIALNTLYDGIVRGHVPGRAEGKKIRRERQGRKERKLLEY